MMKMMMMMLMMTIMMLDTQQVSPYFGHLRPHKRPNKLPKTPTLPDNRHCHYNDDDDDDDDNDDDDDDDHLITSWAGWQAASLSPFQL